MLTAADFIVGKIVVQLGMADADEVRTELHRLDAGEFPSHDLLNRLHALGRVEPRQIELVRHRAALYEHVRREATYLRHLEKQVHVDKQLVAYLIMGLERHAFRRRLGEVLVQQGKLTRDLDRALARKTDDFIVRDNRRILDRYRAEEFRGVGKPLIPGSELAPEDFKISTLFRSRETRALVDEMELRALRAEAARGGGAPDGAAEPEEHEDEQVSDERPAIAASQPEAAVEPGEGPAGMEQVKALKRIADYTIVEVLGAGGMGAVFLGQKDGRGEYSAIKVLLNQAAGPAERGRFLREIELSQRVQHRNTIGVIDHGETAQGLSYLVVPALAGKELRDYLENCHGNGLAPQLVCHIFAQVLEGMQAIHEAGIVHRDMKPENVFVLAGGQHEIKIMDFGLAKLMNEDEMEAGAFRTVAGEVLGSPAYISPEAISCDPMDGRTDIYSLGIMLFEMLTGRLPLESESAQGFLGQHLISPPLTLAEARPEFAWPPEAEDLLARMMAKTRDERPASCNDILATFRCGLREKLCHMKEAPRPEEAAPAAPETKPWGFKGLLGRLWGKSAS